LPVDIWEHCEEAHRIVHRAVSIRMTRVPAREIELTGIGEDGERVAGERALVKTSHTT